MRVSSLLLALYVRFDADDYAPLQGGLHYPSPPTGVGIPPGSSWPKNHSFINPLALHITLPVTLVNGII